jgi:hypothetical protein
MNSSKRSCKSHLESESLARLVRERIDAHEKNPNEVIPMSRDELQRLATGEPSKEIDAFKNDLLQSVKQMKRGHAARKTTAS